MKVVALLLVVQASAWFFKPEPKGIVLWPAQFTGVAYKILQVHQLEIGKTVECKVDWRMSSGACEVDCSADPDYQPPNATVAKEILARNPQFMEQLQRRLRYESAVVPEVREILVALWNKHSTERMTWHQIIDLMP